MSSKPLYGDPQTRDRLLQATWNLIEAQGASFKLSEVAVKAGVSRQAVYLHFKDRTGLLLALVKFMNRTLDLSELLAHVKQAPTGTEALKRIVEVAAVYAPKIDAVARVFEAAQYEDKAIATAWRQTMQGRRADHQAVIQRLADEGNLAEGWTVETATDMFYTLTLPGPWRELSSELGWTSETYVENVTRLLLHGLVVE